MFCVSNKTWYFLVLPLRKNVPWYWPDAELEFCMYLIHMAWGIAGKRRSSIAKMHAQILLKYCCHGIFYDIVIWIIEWDNCWANEWIKTNGVLVSTVPADVSAPGGVAPPADQTNLARSCSRGSRRVMTLRYWGRVTHICVGKLTPIG